MQNTGNKFVQTLRNNFFVSNLRHKEYAWDSPVKMCWTEKWAAISSDRSDELDKGFQKDIAQNPSDVETLCAYAVFLAMHRFEYDRSAELLQTALTIDAKKAREESVMLWAMIESDRQLMAAAEDRQSVPAKGGSGPSFGSTRTRKLPVGGPRLGSASGTGVVGGPGSVQSFPGISGSSPMPE